MQVCSKCLIEKQETEFHKNRARKSGLHTICKLCNIEKVAIWQKTNKERVLENSRKQYHKDIEKSRKNRAARVRKWYAAHPEKGRTAAANWKKANRGRATAYENARRARKKQAGIYLILPKEIERILSSNCKHCGTRDNISIDHIIPLARGGRHSVGNLQPLCINCNSSKNDRTMMEWKLVLKGRD
jgi:5-methylcytosine-specific restriction endonuclease McrA